MVVGGVVRSVLGRVTLGAVVWIVVGRLVGIVNEISLVKLIGIEIAVVGSSEETGIFVEIAVDTGDPVDISDVGTETTDVGRID